MPKTLVTTKKTPDLDGTACLLAYAHLLSTQGYDAEGIVFGNIQPETRYFIEKYGVSVPSESDDTANRWDNYVLVDTSSMKGMPSAVVADKVVEIIDHRQGSSETEFPNAKIQNELIGAAATLVTERFIKAGLKPLPKHARLLYGAIYHNSLNFLASNTSDRDRAAAGFLEKEFGFSPEIIREMFSYSTGWITGHIEEALRDDAKEFNIGDYIGAYQLILYGSGWKDKKQEIESAIAKLASEDKVQWSFLNIVDLESKKSFIYCDTLDGQTKITKALDCVFSQGWADLSMAILRKQIMPKLRELK